MGVFDRWLYLQDHALVVYGADNHDEQDENDKQTIHDREVHGCMHVDGCREHERDRSEENSPNFFIGLFTRHQSEFAG
jgi:hypothetical protein